MRKVMTVIWFIISVMLFFVVVLGFVDDVVPKSEVGWACAGLVLGAFTFFGLLQNDGF